MVLQDGTQKSQRVFVNLPTEVGATEAEEIGQLYECSFSLSLTHEGDALHSAKHSLLVMDEAYNPIFLADHC